MRRDEIGQYESVASRENVVVDGVQGKLEVLLLPSGDYQLVHWRDDERGSEGLLIETFLEEPRAIGYYLTMVMPGL